jgi:DNA-binding NtrC family response regulator
MQAGTILIVDDNKSVLTSLELLLEDEFEGVETASNPNSILSVLDSRPVDLVLLDMNFSAGVNTGFLAPSHTGDRTGTSCYHADCLRGCRVGS